MKYIPAAVLNEIQVVDKEQINLSEISFSISKEIQYWLYAEAAKCKFFIDNNEPMEKGDSKK